MIYIGESSAKPAESTLDTIQYCLSGGPTIFFPLAFVLSPIKAVVSAVQAVASAVFCAICIVTGTVDILFDGDGEDFEWAVDAAKVSLDGCLHLIKSIGYLLTFGSSRLFIG